LNARQVTLKLQQSALVRPRSAIERSEIQFELDGTVRWSALGCQRWSEDLGSLIVLAPWLSIHPVPSASGSL
jgi:hypothetical protein